MKYWLEGWEVKRPGGIWFVGKTRVYKMPHGFQNLRWNMLHIPPAKIMIMSWAWAHFSLPVVIYARETKGITIVHSYMWIIDPYPLRNKEKGRSMQLYDKLMWRMISRCMFVRGSTNNGDSLSHVHFSTNSGDGS